jgi:RNA polymerase sigma-70 factor (ECF subfamily)
VGAAVTQARKASVAPAATDREALEALAQGEISALGIIYDRHRSSVVQFVTRAVSNHADVEDVVHATFMTAMKAAGSFDGRESCRPWLLGIAGRLVQRRRRTLSRFGRAMSELMWHETRDAVDPTHQLGARDLVGRVSAGLQKLSEAKRVVLLLAEVENLSCQEIAQALEIPIGTVWTRLHHGRKELSELLQEADG